MTAKTTSDIDGYLFIDADKASKNLRLSPNQLLETETGEGIFFAGQKHVAIRVQASYTEDQIITTNPEEVLKIKEQRDLGG